ncbi:AAA family ATPase [Haliangium ochraceum]|uniref:ATPase associated with various cellular activities AAA_5 n=1 Tax=Haliangium ochraceum (strain DSM 14365 / JCM 11303 / SMP-2) TaxID=502025 RepID=D0LST3_HALO1|nr:AAA family ATPase [Haliangium ochraceum]ACY17305.1 ATPase associated with various cellular activities AAA_5 [Haliangium ochraceum DSM 14365]
MSENASPPPRPPGSASAPADLSRLSLRFQSVARTLGQTFLDKQEIIRLLNVCAIAGEHMILVGPPGTAKSAIISMFAKLVDARYFEYLLTRFTEPNELFGPVDIAAFREGRYTRRTQNMLPQAEIVFLDEIFKSNSAILNSLLQLVNERRFTNGPEVLDVPLISLFGASNEVPNDDNLAAMFDRFSLRVRSDYLDSYHFHELMTRGVEQEIQRLRGYHDAVTPQISADDLRRLQRNFDQFMNFPEEFLAKYKGLIFQIRSEGISVSDRRAVKLLKLFAASAVFDGRRQVCDGDFFILRHIWNNLDQAELLEEIVNPIVDSYYREHPSERRFLGPQANLEDLLSELEMIRELLTGSAELSDIQLFSQLKNLNEIKAALAAIDNATAQRMLREVDQLLENVFASSKFGA